MKKLFAKIALLAVLIAPLAIALPTQAASLSVGNDNTARTMVDTFSNFTIVDTNHPVSATGTLSSFGYFAANQNPFRFVLVDPSNTVQWVSDQITPPGTGAQSFTPTPSPVSVQAGWNLGVYFSATGTIPFEQTGAPAQYTSNGSGLPTVGGALSIAGNDARTYSFVATGDTGTTAGGGTGQQICTPINLTSGTSTQTAGFTITNPQADPLNAALYSGGGVWTNSALATTIGLIPGPWVDPSVNPSFASSSAMWISTAAAHPGDTANGGQGLANQDQWRLFKTDFAIPSGATVSPITLFFTADNAVTVYFNGSSIATTSVDTFGPVPNPLDSVFSNVYSVTFTPVAGQTNTLAFVVRNSAFDISINPTGLLYNAQSQYCVSSPETPGTVNVTIVKYVDGQPATASSTNSTSFPMNATWSATNIGSGSGSFALGPLGFNNPNPYQATTANMSSGASYGVSEDTSQTNIVGSICASGTPYSLVGYTMGDTLAAAAAATPTTTAPNLSNITSNKFIIVWNKTCGQKHGEVGDDHGKGDNGNGQHDGKGDDNNGTGGTGNNNGNGGDNHQPGDNKGGNPGGQNNNGQGNGNSDAPHTVIISAGNNDNNSGGNGNGHHGGKNGNGGN